MIKYRVMVVSPEEYSKADVDPKYDPKGTQVGEIVAETVDQAILMLATLIRAGRYLC